MVNETIAMIGCTNYVYLTQHWYAWFIFGFLAAWLFFIMWNIFGMRMK